MAKIKYDVSDVEPGIDFDTPIPIGIYKCKIAEAKEDTSKSSGNDMIAMTLQVLSDEKGGKEFKGRNIWDYIVLNDASEWKVRQLTDALGLPTKGAFDPRELIGEQLRVRVKHEPSEEFGTRAKVGSLLALKGKKAKDDADDEDDAEDDGDGDEWTLEDLEGEDEEGLAEIIDSEELDVDVDDFEDDEDGLREAVAEALGIESDDDEEEEEDDEPELSYEDVMKLRMTQLKKLNKEQGLKVRISAKTKLETAREKVAEALGLEDEEEDEPEEIDIDELEASDFEDMEMDVMKQIIDQEDLEIKVTKRSKPESIAAKIMEALEIEDDDEDDDDEEDYDDMDVADLKATCKERGLSAAGTKATLIKRLKKDDAEDGDPF